MILPATENCEMNCCNLVSLTGIHFTTVHILLEWNDAQYFYNVRFQTYLDGHFTGMTVNKNTATNNMTFIR